MVLAGESLWFGIFWYLKKSEKVGRIVIQQMMIIY